MDKSIKFEILNSGWFIVYTEGHMLLFPNNIVFSLPKNDFVVSNRAENDEMPHFMAFNLGLHCLQKYLFSSFYSTK